MWNVCVRSHFYPKNISGQICQSQCKRQTVHLLYRLQEKAFDSVWHDGLFYKLLHYKIGGNFFDLIRNLYSKTKCLIKNADQRTEFFDYQKGVRQGCILSPMSFNLYLNEIPFLLDRKLDTDPIALPNGSNLNCLLYADDLVLISHSAKGLQKALSILEKYCNDWLLSVNPKKTKVVIFQKKCRKSFTSIFFK